MNRAKGNALSENSNSAKRLKENARIPRKNAPTSRHARNEKTTTKITQLNNVSGVENLYPHQLSSHIHDHHLVSEIQNAPSFGLASSPDLDSRGAEAASGSGSTPFSHPEGFPSRRLLNAFLTDSSSSKASSNPSLPDLLSSAGTPKQPALALSERGIPSEVVESYRKNGIVAMFEWQAKCLELPGVLSGGNLVYSAPTSAGKTLVAELLALKCVLNSRKKVIFVFPFVSIAQEKCTYFQGLFESAGVRMGSFVGNRSPPGGLAAVDIAVCTIEKANSLVNRLLEDNQLACVGLVVVDELHMVGDTHRGYLLELLLTKILFTCSKWGGGVAMEQGEEAKVMAVQVVGMSSTLPNLETLAKWLRAPSYHTDYRPVPLTEMVKVGPTLYDTKLRKIRDLGEAGSLPGDEDDVLLLCRETVAQGHSVLIFCPTKNWCEKLAQAIARASFLSLGPDECLDTALIDRSGLVDVCNQLKRTQVGLDPVLGQTIPCSVAFHHAGLTFDEREIVEAAFRRSLIKILTATSTLSCGVNLPARLVIIRTPFFNRLLLDVLIYKQMVGRAGRKGVDSQGESILICKPCDRSKVAALLQSAPTPVRSCLGRREGDKEGDGGLCAVKRAVLEVIVTGMACTVESIQRYMSCTLLHTELQGAASCEREDPCEYTRALLLSAVKFLKENEFISERNNAVNLEQQQDGVSSEYCATQLGVATVVSALSPDEALTVFAELNKARRGFVLENELHLVYLVTPIHIQDQWPHMDWYRYFCILERLPADMKHVATTMGVTESFLGSAIQGNVSAHTETQRARLWVHQRFYTALALHDLVHEVPIPQVAAKYGASKGLLQSLQGAAGTFAGMITVFCNRLGWKNMELLLSQFQSRLTFGVERELCDLVKVPLVNAHWGRVLYNAGFHSLASLATASPPAIEVCLRGATPFRSCRGDREEDGEGGSYMWCAHLRRRVSYGEAAKMIIGEAKSILAEELNIPALVWSSEQTQAGQLVIPTLESKKKKVLGLHGCPVHLKPLHRKVSRSGSSSKQNIRGPVVSPTGVPPSKIKVKHSRFSAKGIPSALEGEEVLPRDVPAAQPCASFVPASHLARRTSASPPPPAETLPSTPPFTRACLSPPLSTHPPHFAIAPNIAIPTALSASTPALPVPPLLANHPVLSPVPPLQYFCFSPDSSLNLSSHTLAILDAACNEVSSPPATGNKVAPKPMVGAADKPSVIPMVGAEDKPSVIPMVGKPSVIPMVGAEDKPSVIPMVDAEDKPSVIPMVDAEDKPSVIPMVGAEGKPSVIPLTPKGGAPPNPTGVTPYMYCEEEADVSNATHHLDYSLHQPSLQDLSALSASHSSVSGITIIDVSANSLLFETFVAESLEQANVSFAMATQSLDQAKDIGTVLVRTGLPVMKGIPLEHSNEQVVGVAFCWGGTDVYYVPLTVDEAEGGTTVAVPLHTRMDAVASIFVGAKCREALVACNAKQHLKSLALSMAVFPKGAIADPMVANWLLDPDSKEKTIHKMVLHYLPNQPVWTEDGHGDQPLSSVATHSPDPQMRAAAEAILSLLLMSSIKQLLESEGLEDAFSRVEMPTVPVLTRMELNGIGFCLEQCEMQKSVLQDHLAGLEKKAYCLAGRSFSLTSPEDVAQVLFVDLRLPSGVDHRQKKVASGRVNKRRKIQLPSTAKNVLEKIVSLHPLPEVILVWRRISTTMTKVIFPLLKAVVLHASLRSHRIHATCQTHTATGRIAVSEPTLQSVPKEYDISTGADTSAWAGPHTEDEANHLVSESQLQWRTQLSAPPEGQVPNSISMRRAFVPFPGATFLAADYSQLELRLLAHLSGDKMLREFLNGDGDVFKMIAGQWLGVPPMEVTHIQRQHAKQVCYGMIYGIGTRALGEQLGVSEEEAAGFMDTFKSKYPAVSTFVAQTIKDCRERGHVTTLVGRKRYLPNIRSTNSHARCQAERQAVNSRIQGSAADLVKKAMVSIDQRLTEQFGVAGSLLLANGPGQSKPPFGAYLVLQMHDELLFEVSSGILGDVAKIVQHEMEHTVDLSVKFPVTIKTGINWGSLKEYRI